MENNSDKHLRDKLRGMEFPFDPQAWAKMEAMLDGKKKRRGFFWWWLTGGIAAALLLTVGTIGWGLYLMSEEDKPGGEQQIVNLEEAPEANGSKQKNTVTVNSSGEKSQRTSENITGKETVVVSSTSKQKNANETTGNVEQPFVKEKAKTMGSELGDKQPQKKSKPLAKNQSAQSVKSAVNSTSNINEEQTTFEAKNPAKQKRKEQLLKKAEQESPRTLVEAFEKNIAEKRQEVTALATAGNQPAERIEMSRLEGLLEQPAEEEKYSMEKKSEDVLPKKKKRIFHYSLGVLANVTGTTLGSQEYSVIRNRRPLPFYKTPSYMAGFTHDFLFVNRVAITNSILFSQTSFKVYSPKTITFTKAPKDYTSSITEIAIPIGIKVYPVVKNNFRFYINTGIINHIKLKETFAYTAQSDTIFQSIVTLSDSFFFPSQTNFSGDYESNMFTKQNTVNGTSDFSINSAKRYYASFYASAGFEYIAKKHWLFFAEPMFYMSLQEIGVQEKRKFNIGVSAGFRYKF